MPEDPAVSQPLAGDTQRLETYKKRLMTKNEGPDNGSERLQAAIDDFNRNAGQSYRLSMSVGAEDLSASAETSLETLLSHADIAMYGRKREQGKQRENRKVTR
jgi:GGDEF domain-containing protein